MSPTAVSLGMHIASAASEHLQSMAALEYSASLSAIGIAVLTIIYTLSDSFRSAPQAKAVGGDLLGPWWTFLCSNKELLKQCLQSRLDTLQVPYNIVDDVTIVSLDLGDQPPELRLTGELPHEEQMMDTSIYLDARRCKMKLKGKVNFLGLSFDFTVTVDDILFKGVARVQLHVTQNAGKRRVEGAYVYFEESPDLSVKIHVITGTDWIIERIKEKLSKDFFSRKFYIPF